jgi:hypothetical protein
VSPEDYWKRISRIPLYRERDTSDGEAVICRAQDGTPVRVTKPEYFKSEEEMEATLRWYEACYSPRRH